MQSHSLLTNVLLLHRIEAGGDATWLTSYGLLTGSPSRVRYHEGKSRLRGRYIDSASYDAQTWLSGNVIAVGALPPVAQWPDEILPYAIITPEGEWHDMEKAGGSTLRDATWITQVQDLINEHLDCVAVVLDCHS